LRSREPAKRRRTIEEATFNPPRKHPGLTCYADCEPFYVSNITSAYKCTTISCRARRVWKLNLYPSKGNDSKFEVTHDIDDAQLVTFVKIVVEREAEQPIAHRFGHRAVAYLATKLAAHFG
jgi:hypothetical protein